MYLSRTLIAAIVSLMLSIAMTATGYEVSATMPVKNTLSTDRVETVAISPFGFCALDLDDETLCSTIRENEDMRAFCQAFATEHHASSWSWWTASSKEILVDQQATTCTRISGGNHKRYGCYVYTKCDSTSSLAPMDLAVFANDEADAIKKCISQNNSLVIDYLRVNSQDGCYTKIGAEKR